MNGPERAGRLAHFFSIVGRPAGALSGTVWNSSQKLPPPHNSTQWDCSQGGWGIVRRSSPIKLPLKCFTHCITNAKGDAMCEAFSLESSFVPRADDSPPKTAKNQPMMADEAHADFDPFHFVLPPPPQRHQICPLVPPVVRVPHCPSSYGLFHLLLTTRSLSRRATDDGR